MQIPHFLVLLQVTNPPDEDSAVSQNQTRCVADQVMSDCVGFCTLHSVNSLFDDSYSNGDSCSPPYSDNRSKRQHDRITCHNMEEAINRHPPAYCLQFFHKLKLTQLHYKKVLLDSMNDITF